MKKGWCVTNLWPLRILRSLSFSFHLFRRFSLFSSVFRNHLDKTIRTWMRWQTFFAHCTHKPLLTNGAWFVLSGPSINLFRLFFTTVTCVAVFYFVRSVAQISFETTEYISSAQTCLVSVYICYFISVFPIPLPVALPVTHQIVHRSPICLDMLVQLNWMTSLSCMRVDPFIHLGQILGSYRSQTVGDFCFGRTFKVKPHFV